MTMFKVAEIFSDGLVFQRKKNIQVFGTAEATDRIRVQFFDHHGNLMDEGSTKANLNNQWTAIMGPEEAATGIKMVVTNQSSYEKIIVSDVSIGEVWLAGGQSNMEFFNKYEKDWKDTKNLPANPNIHFYNVPQRAFEGHDSHNSEGRDGYGKWLKDKEQGYENFSAIGYGFARKIQEQLNVPVAIIGCNWGGTTASAWVPTDVLEEGDLDVYLREYEKAITAKNPITLRSQSLMAWDEIDRPDSYKSFEPLLYGKDRDWQLNFMINDDGVEVPMGPYNENRPGGLYETMLSSVIPYSIQGVLWYQGESDAGERARLYNKLLAGLINSWREAWEDDFPFLIVQLAPFGKWLACENDGYCEVRCQQQKVADTMENVYMASIMDLGSYYDIHPKEKMEIARRLSLLALKHVYNCPIHIQVDSPRIDKAYATDSKLILTFTNANKLTLDDQDNTIKVTVDNNNLTPSELSVSDNSLILKLPMEVEPAEKIQVSMGWDDYAVINIKNEDGLPIAPFTLTL
ncbi:MAG: sialate O-acetylesterase [Pseudobutyrivibrio sp.]|nr:sialate O-acetylesterase [Pseudobutyrivibrio sp.]